MNTFDGVILQRIAQQVQTKRKWELSPVKASTKSIEEHAPLPTKKPRLTPVPRPILVVPQRPTLVKPRLV